MTEQTMTKQIQPRYEFARFCYEDRLRLHGLYMWSDTIKQIELLKPSLDQLEAAYPGVRERYVKTKRNYHADPEQVVGMWAVKKAWAEVLQRRRDGQGYKIRLNVGRFLSQLDSLILDVTTGNPFLAFSDEE